MRAPGVTKLSKNEGKSTLWGSLALAVLLAGRRAICADEPAQEVASIDAVILHAVFWKYYFEHIALLLRIYPIISTSYQQLTHGLTNHLDLNCLSPTLALVLESDKQGHIEFYKYHIFSRSSSTKLPLSCSMISIRSAFVSNSTSDFWKMYSRSYFSSSSIGTGSKGFFASILWMY